MNSNTEKSKEESLGKNMKKIKTVLVQTSFWDTNSPPHGIASLTAYMRKNGHQIIQMDLGIEFYRRNKLYNIWKFLSYLNILHEKI